MNALSQRHAELRHPEQAHALHLDAEPLQLALPRRGARNVPHAEGQYLPHNSGDAPFDTEPPVRCSA